MLAELRAKSQITIPKELVNKLGIKEGDTLEILEKDGVIQLIPVVVFPKKYVEEIQAEVDALKTKSPASYDSISGLLDTLEK